MAEVGPVERMLIAALFETMKAHKGIGLAAPQVGINERIFVLDAGSGALAVINPKIIKSQGVDITEEGCLSIPKVLVNVERSKVILAEYSDENNQRLQVQLSGLTAKAFQHELDHLNGVLIVDYLPVKERQQILKKLKKDSKTGKV